MQQNGPSTQLSKIQVVFFMDFELLLLFYYYYIKAVLRKYLKITKDKRGQESRLLINFQKPFKTVTLDTLSRWVKATMSQAGIEIDRFKPYS